ncbi:HlyD family secretion protein [Oceanimonas baumannii]|uniref:Hemolysin D n=1 Tax=Oceanimonas baumannii TaxID=129578 RepID=A0A235CLM4_9GAMM|nr:HlyD family efflux transporter periplasmic adaptor subunit [Oceanimonas baumannii]OYD25440.1 hemolysin D [Oceanimonas baumannii]TDW61363.1 HlyD family secretion protein [Oceanimonas baumannii]
MKKINKKHLLLLALLAVAAVAAYVWQGSLDSGYGEGFVSGNGRIEATEIDVATKQAGRVEEILVREGSFVQAGMPLARMQVTVLEAQREEARAQHQQALNAVNSARAQVLARESEQQAARALVAQREAEEDAARRRYERSRVLTGRGSLSQQQLDDDKAALLGASAAVSAARAQVNAAEAGVEAARAQVVGTESAVAAAAATIARIQADIDDSQLSAPRDGRVQYLIAQPGEVLGGGGKVLNLVDLTDVYMTFFLPSELVGRLALGSEARILLDAAPEYVIPARISFISDIAQYTPKTVETASERQKLMFRVRAQVDPDLLRAHLTQVKTGLPGVVWVRLEQHQPWPEDLTVKLEP